MFSLLNISYELIHHQNKKIQGKIITTTKKHNQSYILLNMSCPSSSSSSSASRTLMLSCYLFFKLYHAHMHNFSNIYICHLYNSAYEREKCKFFSFQRLCEFILILYILLSSIFVKIFTAICKGKIYSCYIIDINTIVYFTTFKTVIRYCMYVFIYT